MKRTMITLVSLTTWATPAVAAGGMETEGNSLITILLLGFGGLIVAAQLIPGLVMLFAMIKGLLGNEAIKAKPVADHK